LNSRGFTFGVVGVAKSKIAASRRGGGDASRAHRAQFMAHSSVGAGCAVRTTVPIAVLVLALNYIGLDTTPWNDHTPLNTRRPRTITNCLLDDWFRCEKRQ